MLSLDDRTIPSEVVVFPSLRNWYCPACRKFVASSELDERRVHFPCKTKATWEEYTIETCQPWMRQRLTVPIPRNLTQGKAS